MHRTANLCPHGLCLLAVVLSAACAAAGNRPPRREPPPPTRTVFEHTFTASADTIDGARQNALEDACRWMAQQARLGWVPPPEYLRAQADVSFSPPTDDVLDKGNPDKPIKVKVVQMKLTVNNVQAEQIAQEARHQVMTARHGLLARVLAGALAVVLVCAGYLRLEELTRGYYTLLLRAGALLVLAGVGAVLWLTTL
jgi:hypothetical protein